MRVGRYILSMLPFATLAAAVSLALTGEKADIPAKGPSAEEIAEDWQYNPELKGKGWEKHWTGFAPKNSHKLYVQTGRITGATLEGAWNFYAKKCGHDKKYGESSGYFGGQSKDGEYAIIDIERDGLRTTTFAFTNQRFTVSVQLRQAPEKDKFYIYMTVAKH